MGHDQVPSAGRCPPHILRVGTPAVLGDRQPGPSKVAAGPGRGPKCPSMASLASMTCLGALALLCGCASAGRASKGGSQAAAPPANVEVVRDDGQQVAEAFNAHADRVRVLEIVSPTCEAC